VIVSAALPRTIDHGGPLGRLAPTPPDQEDTLQTHEPVRLDHGLLPACRGGGSAGVGQGLDVVPSGDDGPGGGPGGVELEFAAAGVPADQLALFTVEGGGSRRWQLDLGTGHRVRTTDHSASLMSEG
jgi:hypothetical protein